jgi:hypothetical protein
MAAVVAEDRVRPPGQGLGAHGGGAAVLDQRLSDCAVDLDGFRATV